MWCVRCRGWVWTNGTECPARHFSTLRVDKPGKRIPAVFAGVQDAPPPLRPMALYRLTEAGGQA